MSGAWRACGAALLLAAPSFAAPSFTLQDELRESSGAAVARVVVEPKEVPLGGRCRCTFEVEAADGAELAVGGRFALDPALLLLEQQGVAAEARSAAPARLTFELQACAPGRFSIAAVPLRLTTLEGAEQLLASEPFVVEVRAPWGDGDAPPPFAEWRRADRSEPTGAKGWSRAWWAAGLAAALLLAARWQRRRVRRSAAAEAAPAVHAAALERALLRTPLPVEAAARRAWCARVAQLLRAEFAARSGDCRYEWVAAELLLADGAGAWPATQQAQWRALLEELERARFAADGPAALAADLGERLFAALAAGDR
ncbi:MAG: hypothetical protein JNL90_07390 [Planctomycetes bacterium]|nr:hypothetical protein [Planctomycetota bacterium]